MAHVPEIKYLFSRLFSMKNGLSARCGLRHYSKDLERPLGKDNVPRTNSREPLGKGSVTALPPLSEPMPDLPPVVFSNAKAENTLTEVTVLSNGLRVASEKKFGQFCTAGVVIDSGPRYEVAYPNGICHFLEKLSFGATHKYATRDMMLHELERHGGICDCQGSRDTTVYATSADSKGLEAITQVLAEVTLRPQLSTEEIEAARQAVAFELETLSMRPEQESILMDMIHSAAYKGNTLGLPKICPKENVNSIDRHTILNYLRNHYTPEKMVVAAVGVDHGPFVEYVQKYFVDIKPTWHYEFEDSDTFQPKVDQSIAQYVGSIEQDECEVPLYPGSDLPELSHVVIALESCSHSDPDFVATCVLNMMMGGGGSFSAGGPGKGMYTRLYTNVLNRYHWMFNATAYNHAYGDTGLFCVHSASPPNRIYDTTLVIARELANMAGKVGEMELRRAKTQLQSMLLMNLEARPVVFEDVGRQVLATGKRKPPSYFISEIEKITADDIIRVARRMLSQRPSVAARGKLAHLPSFEEIQSNMSLGKSDAKSQGRRLNLFRN